MKKNVTYNANNRVSCVINKSIKFMFISSIICLSITSCKRGGTGYEDNSDYLVISAPLKQHEMTEMPKNSVLFDTIDYVRLSSDIEGSLVGNINDIKIVRDDIFILSNNNTLFHFLKDGSFIDKLYRKGRGRGEYLNIERFDVSNDGSKIFIFDNNQRKVIVYSNDFDYLRQIDLEDIIFDFAVTNNDDLLLFNPKYFGQGRRGAWLTDSLGRFKKQLLTINDSYKHEAILDHYLVHINENEIGLLGLEDNDCFYRIKSDSIYISAKMVTDIKMSKKTKRKQESNPKTEQYVKAGYFETDNYIQFDLSDLNSDMVTVRYDKRNNTVYRTYLDDYTRITQLDEIFLRVISSHNSTVISCLTPVQIMGSSFYSMLFPEITENSNPVLVIEG